MLRVHFCADYTTNILMFGYKDNLPKKVLAPIFNFARKWKKAVEVEDSFFNPISVNEKNMQKNIHSDEG